MKPLVVGVTGSSGAVYGVRLVKVLAELGIPTALVISEPARLVIREELKISLQSLTRLESLSELFGASVTERLSVYSVKDFTAPIASGSYPVQGMAIVPCSMGTLGAVAGGLSQNLIHRAADCAIKEGRRLVLVPRETPLSAIHLENMLKLSRLGVRIVPAMPAFYSGVKTVEDLVDFVVGKVLDQFEIPHGLYARWTGMSHEKQDAAWSEGSIQKKEEVPLRHCEAAHQTRPKQSQGLRLLRRPADGVTPRNDEEKELPEQGCDWSEGVR